MTLPRLAAMNKSWKIVPPQAESLAAIAIFLGAIKRQSRAAAGGSLNDLLAEFGAVGGQIQGGQRG